MMAVRAATFDKTSAVVDPQPVAPSHDPDDIEAVFRAAAEDFAKRNPSYSQSDFADISSIIDEFLGTTQDALHDAPTPMPRDVDLSGRTRDALLLLAEPTPWSGPASDDETRPPVASERPRTSRGARQNHPTEPHPIVERAEAARRATASTDPNVVPAAAAEPPTTVEPPLSAHVRRATPPHAISPVPVAIPAPPVPSRATTGKDATSRTLAAIALITSPEARSSTANAGRERAVASPASTPEIHTPILETPTGPESPSKDSPAQRFVDILGARPSAGLRVLTRSGKAGSTAERNVDLLAMQAVVQRAATMTSDSVDGTVAAFINTSDGRSLGFVARGGERIVVEFATPALGHAVAALSRLR